MGDTRKRWVAVAAVLGTAGCLVGPNYHAPKDQMPGAYAAAPATRPATTQGTSVISPGEPPLDRWWLQLNDPTLNRLIEQVIAGSPDVSAAGARLRAARAQDVIAEAAQYPEIDLHATFGRSRGSNYGVPDDPRAYPGEQANLYDLGFDANWEADIFGGIRRSIEAAHADRAAATEDRNAVLLSLTAETARTYIQLRDLQQRLAIARSNVADQTHTRDLTENRFEHGLANYFDVLRADAQLQMTTSEIPQLEAAVASAIHRIAIAAGMAPEALFDRLTPAGSLPHVPPRLPIGVPSDLVRRRPDIRRAERELAAASARVGVATSDLYPRLKLAGVIGVESTMLSNLFHLFGPTSGYYAIGPSGNWVLYDAGRRHALIDVRSAEQQQAMADYERTVLAALSETEDALVRYDKEQVRLTTLHREVDDARRAVKLARSLYARGVVDFLAVLQAQLAYYTAEDQESQADAQVAITFVSLNLALGGGWTGPPPADTRTPSERVVQF